jgi:hypothetical protein
MTAIWTFAGTFAGNANDFNEVSHHTINSLMQKMHNLNGDVPGQEGDQEIQRFAERRRTFIFGLCFFFFCQRLPIA